MHRSFMWEKVSMIRPLGSVSLVFDSPCSREYEMVTLWALRLCRRVRFLIMFLEPSTWDLGSYTVQVHLRAGPTASSPCSCSCWSPVALAAWKTVCHSEWLLLQIDSLIASLICRDTCHMLGICLSCCVVMNQISIITLSHGSWPSFSTFFHRKVTEM